MGRFGCPPSRFALRRGGFARIHLQRPPSVYVLRHFGPKSRCRGWFFAAYVLDSIGCRGRAGQRDAYRQALASPHPVLVHDSSAALFLTLTGFRLQTSGFTPEAGSRKPEAFGGF